MEPSPYSPRASFPGCAFWRAPPGDMLEPSPVGLRDRQCAREIVDAIRRYPQHSPSKGSHWKSLLARYPRRKWTKYLYIHDCPGRDLSAAFGLYALAKCVQRILLL